MPHMTNEVYQELKELVQGEGTMDKDWAWLQPRLDALICDFEDVRRAFSSSESLIRNIHKMSSLNGRLCSK